MHVYVRLFCFFGPFLMTSNYARALQQDKNINRLALAVVRLGCAPMPSPPTPTPSSRIGMATGRVRIGWSVWAPKTETRT
jgi:hypothetical protein